MSELSQENLGRIIEMQKHLMDLDQEGLHNQLTSLIETNNLKELFDSLVHNLIVTSIYRAHQIPKLAAIVADFIKLIPQDIDFLPLLLEEILLTTISRAYTPLRCATCCFLFNLVEIGVYSIIQVTNAIRDFSGSKIQFEQMAFNVFVWLAPEIQLSDPGFFAKMMKYCMKLSQQQSLYPTVDKFLKDFQKLSMNDFQGLKQRRSCDISLEIYPNQLRNDNLQYMEKISTHRLFNIDQQMTMSIHEPAPLVSNGPTLIEYASYCGAETCFNFLLDHGANIELCDQLKRQISYFAIAGRSNEIKNKLIAKGVSFDNEDVVSAEYFYPVKSLSPDVLLKACASNNLEVVSRCIKEGVDPNYVDAKGKTAFIYASQYGHLNAVKLLLQTGKIDINKKDDDEMSALQFAAQNGYAELVNLLLSLPGIDVNSCNKFKMNSLLWAAQKGYNDVFATFLGFIDVNTADEEGWTPIHWAVQSGNYHILQLLLGIDYAKLDAHQKDGLTPLHYAAMTGNNKAAKMLLSKKVDVNSIDNDGSTPLLWAAQYNKAKVIFTIGFSPKTDVNKTDNEGWTALHWAAQNDNKEAVEAILSLPKYDVNKQNNQGLTALHIAVANNSIECVRSICMCPTLDANIPAKSDLNTALHLAARNGFTDILIILLGIKNVDVNAKQKSGMTPLHIAASNGHGEIVEILLNQEGIKIDEKDVS